MTSRLTRGVLRQYPSIGLQRQLDAGRERHEFVRPGPDRRLLEAVVADLLDIFLRHDPAGAGGAAVERQKIGPRVLQREAHMPRIGGFDRGDPLLEHVVRGAAIALERELHVLGGDRIAVVEVNARRAARNRSAARPSTPRRTRRGSARSACPASASRPRRAARTASCTGVMIPEVSAGSNQVGASETCDAPGHLPLARLLSGGARHSRHAGGHPSAASARSSRRLGPERGTQQRAGRRPRRISIIFLPRCRRARRSCRAGSTREFAAAGI